MSPIGAIILGILLITGMMFAAGNYKDIGFSTNTWVAVNIIFFAVLIIHEIAHKVRTKNKITEEDKNEETKIE
jgi:hypothetical protein